MITLRRILSAGALVVLSSCAAFGTTITQTFSLPSASNATNWTQSANISQFDTSLGTLQTISFKVVANTTVTGAATDDNAGSAGTDTYTFLGTTNLTFGDPTNTLILAPTTSVTQTFNNQSLNSVMSVSAAPASTTVQALYIVDPTNGLSAFCGTNPGVAGCLFSGSGKVDPLNYLAYEGAGTIALTIDAQTFAAFSGPSYRNASGSGTANATITVVYNYTPVTVSGTPEPTTMVLFGSALVGLGFMRRRSKN